MSNLQAYKLLENGEDPAAEPDQLDTSVPISKGRRQVLESIQSLKAHFTFLQERSAGVQEKLPRWLRPICGLWSCLFILAAILIAVVVALVVLGAFAGEIAGEDVLQYVDPLIGTGPGGHVFAGATLPFGMAKAVADSSGREKMGGYASDGSMIDAFSSLHDSGTGGSPSMGNFPIFLQPSCPNMTDCRLLKSWRGSSYIPETVNATPGYFAIELKLGLRAEMTTSERASMFKFSFKNNTNGLHPVLMQDASDLPASKGTRTLNVDASTGRMTAEGTFNPSFGQGHYKTYTCIDIKGAQIESVGGFNDSDVYPGLTTMRSSRTFGIPRHGVYTRFKDFRPEDELLVRVGLSWLSIERACENAEKQIGDWNFDRLRRDAEKAWRKKLSPIRIESTGVDRSHLRNYWSGVYRAFLSPQDYTGENQLWKSKEPYYDSWYCIWDTFRGVHPFFMLVDTVSQSRMVRSLLDVYQHLGWLPDCRMSFCKGLTQGGSNADIVIVDSYVKKLKGVDWNQAYKAVVKDAEEQPPNWDVEGRGGLASWKSVGYIPYHDDDTGGMRTRSVSRTLEYAYNDFVIAQMANATNRESDYLKYIDRSGNWKNVYNEDLESMGFKGFPQPRYKNGTWGFQNATLCSSLNSFDSCYLNPSGHETYEGSPWLYLFYVPGDMQGLINQLGGRDAFLQRLDKLHNSGVLYMGDEQAFLTAFLYHYAGRPGLSSAMTHRYIPSMFNDTIDGIPGNDDSGAMGTFVFFSMLGIFPSAGQSVYFIIPPYFPSISIENPQTGKTATIRCVNFDPTYKNMFVQSAKLNGKTYTKNWIDHEFFLNGGLLEIVVGDTESEWGTKPEDVPPSLSAAVVM